MNEFVLISPEELQLKIEVAVSKVLSNFEKSEPIELERNKVLLLKQAADYVKMPVATFREYLARNEIKGAKIGKSWRFFPEDLDQFVKKHLRKTNEEIEKKIDDELSK